MFKNLGNVAGLIKQAQKMREEFERVHEELKERVVEGSAGAGAVIATANGRGELLTVKITPEAVDPEDMEMLEDLVVAAANQALSKSQQLKEEELAKVTGGLNLPGLFP